MLARFPCFFAPVVNPNALAPLCSLALLAVQENILLADDGNEIIAKLADLGLHVVRV